MTAGAKQITAGSFVPAGPSIGPADQRKTLHLGKGGMWLHITMRRTVAA